MTTPPKPSKLPVVLHSRHQWLRWRGTLIAGIAGLAATLLALWLVPASWHAPGHVRWMAELWGGGLFLTAIAIVLSARAAPASLLVTARSLDGRFAGKGRLEAVAVLKDSTSPLAIAQREETARYLEQQTQARAVRALPWLTSGFVLLILAHLLTLLLWLAPAWISHSIPAAKPALAATPPPSQPAPAPESSIAWKTPEQAVQANPSEDVPATATVDSTTGLQNLTLDVSVNGQVVKSIPLPSDSAATPGSHEIKVSIPLDEVKAQPFDVVSYDLHGQSISASSTSDVTSPVQFVEVRPFHDSSSFPPQDTPDSALSNTPRSEAYALLNQLELAELHSISDNFALAHNASAPTDPAHAAESKRVGQEQADLSKQADQIAKTLGNDHLPAGAVDPVHQAEPLMDDSGRKILAAQNNDAATSQEKALSLIGQAEKAVYQAPSTDVAANNPNNSFENEPPHVLAPRQQTLLGQLETLEKNQTQLAGEMSQSTGDATNTAQPTTVMAPVPASPPAGGTTANATPGSAPQPPPASPTSQPPAPTPAPQPAPASQPSQTPAPSQSTQAPPSAPPSPGSPPPAPSQTSQPSQTAQTPASPASQPTAVPPVDPFGPDATKGSFAERQDNVVKGIATLQSGDKISPGPGSDDLASAEKEAADSLHQLGAEQESAAREPAATAALDLQATVKALNQEGQAETRKALAETQQKLNDMASQLRELAQTHPTDAAPHLMGLAQEVHEVQQGLQNAADHQENTGSAQGADQLNRLASQIQERKVAPNLAAMSKGSFDPNGASAQADALESLATQAASALAPAQPSAQNYADLAGALERSEANLAHLANEARQSGAPDSSSPGETTNPTGNAPGSTSGQPSGSQPGQPSGTQPNQQAGSQPGAQPSPSTGSQPGQPSGTQPNQQASSQPGQQPGSQPGQQANPPAGQQANSPPTQPPSGSPSGANPTAAQATNPDTSAAFHDALQDLKNQIQQTAPVVPNADAAAVDNMIVKYDKDTSYRPVKGVDVVRFHTDLQKPLEKLIVDVQALQDHARRDEIVKAPDLDETPAIYRPAVSRYFEDLSHDYQSPAPPESSKP